MMIDARTRAELPALQPVLQPFDTDATHFTPSLVSRSETESTFRCRPEGQQGSRSGATGSAQVARPHTSSAACRAAIASIALSEASADLLSR